MHQITIALAALCVAVVRGNSTCHDCGTPKCGPNEVPVMGNPRRDLFCRPLYTPPSVLKELRKCVCKPQFVRNSWGECVSKTNCRRCKPRLQKDWHTCSSSCPITGNKAISLFCRTMCTPGCDCPPGWVVDPRNWKNCVKAVKYPPLCPPNSRFEPCVSTCEPVCGFIQPRFCFTHCHRGACVCNKGFTAFVRSGAMNCVRQEECLLYLRTASFSILNKTAYGGGATTLRSDNIGGFITAPDGMVPRSSSGHVLSGDVAHSISTIPHGIFVTGVNNTTISNGATFSRTGSEMGSMGAGASFLASSARGTGRGGSGIGGGTVASASGGIDMVSMRAPGSLSDVPGGLIAAGVNGESFLRPDSAGTSTVRALLGAAGSHTGVRFEHGALSSSSHPAVATVLSAGRGHGTVTAQERNSLSSASAGPGGVGIGAGSVLSAVYSGRGGITTALGGTSLSTPFSAASGGIRGSMASTDTDGGVHIEHGALSSSSRTAGVFGLSAGTVHGSNGGGVGNTLSHTPVPPSNFGSGARNVHRAVSSVSTGIMSVLGGPTAHKPLASQPSGVRTGSGPPDTNGGGHITPGTSIIDPGTSLASSSLISATERMHTIRRSLVIKPSSSSRTPEIVSAETSALPSASGIHRSIRAGPAGASAIGVTSEAPSTHLFHSEHGAVNIRTNSAGTTGFMPSATDLGAIRTSTGSVPTPLIGNRAMGDTTARTIFHGALTRPGVVGAGRGGTGRNPAFSAEHGGARVRLGTTEIYRSAPVGSRMNSLGAGSTGTAGSLSLAAPGLSRVGINTVSAIAPSSVRGITGAPESSVILSGVSLQPNGISASVSTSGTSQPPSAGFGEVGLELGATSSTSHGIARPGTVHLDSRQPYFSLGTSGATVLTGAENGINVAGENPRPSVGFSNVLNRAVISTTASNAPDLSGTPEPLDLGDITGIEAPLTSVSRVSGGSGILINRGSESLNSGGDNARTSSIITAGHGVASGATVHPEGTRFGRVTGTAAVNNVTVTGLPPSATLRSHTGTGLSYTSEIGRAGLPVPSGSTGSRDVGAFGGTVITTNTHSTHGSGASVSSLSREASEITGTDTYAAGGSRIGPGGEVLPSAATSSVIGLGTYSSGVTTEGGNWNARTTGGAHSGVASPSRTLRHGERMGSTYDVGQHFPSSAGYLRIGYSINPYLPGFMLNAGKEYADTSLTIKPADTNALGGTRGDPIGHRSLGESEDSLPGNMNISGVQPIIGGATVRTSTSR
uniref:TIL domain containing protein n=1 Tax=Rhipicephalus appendiculatus TaxID=34631 RepID=A0A131YQU9_RHIAP